MKEESGGKSMGLRARITAGIMGVVGVTALFFFAFVHHQAQAVYVGLLDSVLLTWGERAELEPGLSVACPAMDALGPMGGGATRLSLGCLKAGDGPVAGWERVGLARDPVGDELVAAHAGLLTEARLAGRPIFRSVELSFGMFRLMALPPLAPEGDGLLIFAPVSNHPLGTEGLATRFSLAVGLLFLVAMAGSSLCSWMVIRPIEELRDVSEKIAEGILDEGVELTGSAEFVSLSRSINRMRRAIAEKIEESESQNRALVEKGEALSSSNRELERAIFKANQMAAESEIRSYELEHEVVQRRQAEEALRSSEEKYRTIVENMKEGYCEVNREGYITFVNAAMCEMSGYTADEIMRLPRGHYVSEESRSRVFAAFNGLRHGHEDLAEFDYIIVRKDGRRRHIGVSVSLIRNAAGAYSGYRTLVRDVEARKRYEEELIHMAYHDPLTGLKNRKGFYECLESGIIRAKRYGGQVALLYIDIDRFKEVNDTLGHEAGDLVLQEITRRLVENLRQSDCVARIGGDEFAVVLDNDGGCDVGTVIAKVAAMLAQPYRVGELSVDYVSGSIGVALFPDDAVTANDLIRSADNAMYAVKRERKGMDAEGVATGRRA